jgi:hypothetical protein
MSQVEPFSFEVSLVYKCHECETLHYISREETIFPAGILCFCGKKLKLRSVESFDVSPNFVNGSQKARVTPEIKKDIDTKHDEVLFNETVEALVSLGYTKKEAKKRTVESMKQNEDLEECIKQSIY